MYKCRVCNNIEGNNCFTAQEMMLGFKDEFLYFECSKCGCVQISEIPDNIDKYYPQDYYSLGVRNNTKEFIRYKWNSNYFNKKNFIGSIISFIYKKPIIFYFKDYIRTGEDNILDIGCGTGNLLLALAKIGFTHLDGVDPFIERDIDYKNGVRIFKKHVYEIDKKYDFIMLNHSFEHMDKPEDVLKHINRILHKDRYILIRIPVSDSYAYKKYGKYWYQLDAPRHFFLHTKCSIGFLSKRTGFVVEKIGYDSDPYQFTGSDLYMRGIPLKNHSFYNKITSIIKYRNKARELNLKQEGDQACFVLKKVHG